MSLALQAARLIVISATASLLCPLATSQVSAVVGFGAYPPSPKIEPHQELVFGISVDDPYRWMELPARREELVGWIEASTAQTKGVLAMFPGRAALLRNLKEASQASAEHYNVQQAGERLFFLETAPDGDVPVLKVREKGQDRVLVDPAVGGGAKSHRAINNYTPSRDGNLVAVHIAEGGGEVGSTYIFEVVSGRQLTETLSPVWGQSAVNWIDNQTLTYLRMNPGVSQEEAIENMSVYFHRIGDPALLISPF